MGVTWGPFRDDGKDAAPYCPRPSMVLPRCPQRRAGELQGGVLRRRARHRPPRPTGSAAGLPAPVPASPLPAGRARSPPPERGGSRGDGGGGDCDQGSQWPGHGHPAGPGDGPVATVGQGKGRQGAGTARARCGVLCLARADAGARLSFLPSAREDRGGARSSCQASSGPANVCPGRVVPRENQPSLLPGCQFGIGGASRVGPNAAGRRGLVCLRSAGVWVAQTASSCSAVGGASPAHPESFRPAYSFSSWGLCRTPFPSTSPKCLVASTGPPGGAPPGSFSSNLSLASRLFLQACYLFSWNVLCSLLLNLLLMLLLSCFGSHVFILHLTPANRVVEPDYFTNVHGS